VISAVSNVCLIDGPLFPSSVCFVTGSILRRLFFLIWKQKFRSQNYANKSAPPLPSAPLHCDALTSVFHPCSSASMVFQRFFTSKVQSGCKLLPRFYGPPCQISTPLVPCSGLTASINKVPINNNIVYLATLGQAAGCWHAWEPKCCSFVCQCHDTASTLATRPPGGAADSLPALLKNMWSYRLSALGRFTVPVHTNSATGNTSLFCLLVRLASS